jgi:AraC-like DNA-binding protein
MLPAGDHSPLGSHVQAKLRGLELVLDGGDRQRPVLTAALCLLIGDGEEGSVRPGRQPFTHLAPTQMLARAPTQMLPFVEAGGVRVRCRVLLFERWLIDALGDGARRLIRFHSLIVDDAELVALARGLCDAVERDADADELRPRVRGLIDPVCAAFAALRSRPATLTPAVARARDLLHERFADSLRLDDVAQVVGMSKCHLVHRFHEELGLPPHAYQIQLRVAYARHLLAGGTPLAEIASLTGFADQSHLTRLFKRVVGISPGRYATAMRLAPALARPALGG